MDRKYPLVVVVILGVAAAGVIYRNWYHAGATEAISFDVTEVDLGSIAVNQPQKFAVRLRNRSGNLAKIDSVSAGCACTEVACEEMAIPPHGQTTVTGTFRGSREPGKILVKLKAVVDHRDFYVLLRGYAHPEMEVVPAVPQIKYNPLTNETGHAEFTIRNRTNTSMKLAATAPSAGLTVDLRGCTELGPGDATNVYVSFHSESVVDSQLKVSIQTDSEFYKTVLIPIDVIPHPGITLTPSTVHLGVVSRSGISAPKFVIALSGTLLDELELSTQPVCDEGITFVRHENRDGGHVFHFAVEKEALKGTTINKRVVFLIEKAHNHSPVSIEARVSGHFLDD